MSNSTNTKIVDKIIQARVKLLLDTPFFGSLAVRLKIVDGSGWIPTAATDGKHLYYNTEFFESLSLDETAWVIGHEVMHCVYDHMDRRGSRDPMLWNCAGDYIINQDLEDQKVGSRPKMIDVLLDDQYRGMASDQVYELLKKEDDKQPKMKIKIKMSGGGSGQSGGGEAGDGDQNDSNDGSGGGGDGEEQMNDFRKKLAEGQFDVHLDEDDTDTGNGKGKDSDKTGHNGPIPMTEDEKRSLGDEIRQAVMQAAKAAGDGAGSVPAGVKRLIKDLTESVMDWREMLNATIQSIVKSDFTFTRQSRKSQQSGIYLPGMLNDEAVEVAVAIDTSGSIGETMLRDFLGEVKGIMEQFNDFDLKLWFFDTEVYTLHEFTHDNVDELMNVDIEGGGGTMFECNWEFMKENELEPNRFVMFTDGYPCGTWGDEDYCDTIFIIHANHEIVAPFGESVNYTDHLD